ncbi:MAG: hypothetical protein R3F48_05245 [Candidatus Zixiibacteriota bacterium]
MIKNKMGPPVMRVLSSPAFLIFAKIQYKNETERRSLFGLVMVRK